MMQSPGTFYLRRKHPGKHELQTRPARLHTPVRRRAWEHVLTEDIGFIELNETAHVV